MTSDDADWLGEDPDKRELYRRALAKPARLALLRWLDDQETVETSLEALTDVVTESDHVDSTWDETILALHHIHLPMLEEYGVLRYDPETSRVHRRADVHTPIPVPSSSISD